MLKNPRQQALAFQYGVFDMYRFLSNIYPRKLKDDYKKTMVYSGIKIDVHKFIGFVIALSFLSSVAAAFFLGYLFEVSFWVTFFLGFFGMQVLAYFLLLIRADSKARFVESILPDVLHLMSSNLRAGLTTDKALLLAARPEFGPFQDEINQVGKEITMGKEISEALAEISKKIKSERLKKTIALIVSGLRSGGELSALLEQTAKNLRQERMVDSMIRANVMMYVIFIFTAVCFGAPMLFGLSSFLVEVMTESLGAIEIPKTAAAQMPISFSDISIDPSFVVFFSCFFLISSSILGALILGLISKGKEREGIKFMPILIVLSLLVFFLVRFGI